MSFLIAISIAVRVSFTGSHSHTEDAACGFGLYNKNTGITCIASCIGEADCVSSRCVCKEGFHSVKGKCIKCPQSLPKDVAVIGGGIAGITSALELVIQGKNKVNITIYEQAEKMGHLKSASGIIAASLIYNKFEQYWGIHDIMDDVLDPTQWLDTFWTLKHAGDTTSGSKNKFSLSWNKFTKKFKNDKRHDKNNQKEFLKKSLKRMKFVLEKFPELCYAIIGPYCCESPKVVEWMKKNGESCEKSTHRGWAHSFFENRQWDEAKIIPEGIDSPWTKAEEGSEIYNKVKQFLYLDEKDYDGPDLKGVIWNDKKEGFVRVEDLFEKGVEILKNHGVEILTNQHVNELSYDTDSFKVKVRTIAGKEFSHDGVIVCTGANVKLLHEHDDDVMNEMLPVKGYAYATDSPLIPEELRGIGVQHEDDSHYIRAQRNGGVRYGWGKEFDVDLWDEEALLNPTIDEEYERETGGILSTPLGRKIASDPKTKKLAGIRPLTLLNDFPLLKTYSDLPQVVLNTGYGWYGFSMSWKSSEIAVKTILEGDYTEIDYAVEHKYGSLQTISSILVEEETQTEEDTQMM